MRQTIRLTESELRQMIEESINDAMLEEGVLDGINALKDKATNFLSREGQNLKQNTQKFVSDKMDKAKEYYNDKKEQIGQKVKNMKDTYYAGSINGDVQNYLKSACDSLNNLITANQRLIDKGINPVLSGRQINYVKSVYKALSNKYVQAFNNMRDNYVNPSGQN